MDNPTLVELTAEIVAAHVSNNNVDVGEIGNLVQRVHEALASLGVVENEPESKVPVVSVRASIKPDRLICMECGREAKMLKRHLQTAHGMSPADYRRDYGLPESYPMVAPEYAGRRSDMAKAHGFGRKAGEKPAPKAKRTGRKPKAAGDAGPSEA